MTYKEVKELVLDKGYIWFDGIMDPNLITFRLNDTYTNTFSDKLALCWVDTDGNQMIYEDNISTKPALYGTGSVTNPNVIHVIKGVGVIKPGQYRSCWEMKNIHDNMTIGSFIGNPHMAPSLWQVGNFTVFRDGDLDTEIDTDIEKASDYRDGFNFHYAGTIMLSYPNAGLPWSTGCFTALPPVMLKMMNILYECSQYTGTKISLTLI